MLAIECWDRCWISKPLEEDFRNFARLNISTELDSLAFSFRIISSSSCFCNLFQQKTNMLTRPDIYEIHYE